MPVALAFAAILALLPLGVVAWRGDDRTASRFWPALGAALAGAGAVIAVEAGGGVPAGFADALWLSVGACLCVYGIAAVVFPESRRLAVLLVPFLVLSAVLATVWLSARPRALAPEVGSVWGAVHVVASLATYALVALAAVAGIAIEVQEGAIKRKSRGALSRRLPSMAACERIEIGALAAGAAVLGVGIATGMAWSVLRGGPALPADHKSILALVALVLVLGVLTLHWRTGLRGRVAARWVVAALFVLVLAYPGVKFVTEVLLGR